VIYVIASFIWWQILSITVISSGYHRYFAHRSFSASTWYEWYVLSLGTLTGGGSLLGWVGVHRMHHKHADTQHDPHSPMYKGALRVLTSTFYVPPIKRSSVRDLLRNYRVVLFHKYYKHIRIATLVLGFIVLPIEWFVVFVISPIVYAYIGFGAINTFCHDRHTGGAKNSQLVNILAAGDGFHKNHHDAPTNWKIGKAWYEFDPGAAWISIIKKDSACLAKDKE
jgi:stearoyl-CoA desaturase (delta-9 desaturase)